MKTIINYKGFEFECDVDYQPEERETYEYPGCVAEWQFYNITLNGIDATELLDLQIEDFEEEAIKQLTNN